MAKRTEPAPQRVTNEPVKEVLKRSTSIAANVSYHGIEVYFVVFFTSSLTRYIAKLTIANLITVHNILIYPDPSSDGYKIRFPRYKTKTGKTGEHFHPVCAEARAFIVNKLTELVNKLTEKVNP